MPDGLSPSNSGRILMTTDAVGGVWRYTLDLAQGLLDRGLYPIVAALGPPPSTGQSSEATQAGITLVRTGLALDWTAPDRAALMATTVGLKTLAAVLGVEAIHLHAPALAGPDRWAVPLVAVAHSCTATWWQAVRGGPLPADFTWRAAATRDGLLTADAVIAPTRAHAEAVRQAYGPMPIEVVHNGASVTARPDQARERSVLTAGRLWDEGKNAAALDRVAPALDAPIHAAGPLAGPNGAAVALPNLRLLGNLDNAAMHSAYAHSTVFASMARYEPFGLSVLEAASAGMHLVLADIPSFRELWDGVATFADETTLLAALQAALADPADGAARARAATYSLDATTENTLSIHRRLGVRV